MVTRGNCKRGAVVANTKQHCASIGLREPAKRSFEMAMNKVEFQNAS